MPTTQRVLAADIGGTNARFAVFRHESGPAGPKLELDSVVWLSTAELSGAASVLAAFRRALQLPTDVGPEAADALAVALAGPVSGGCGCLTNGSLRLDSAEMASGIPVVLMNDFLAQAYACACLPEESVRPVFAQESGAEAGSVRAVVGAGTGVGAAVLWECAGRLHALPSEAGHASFALVGREEEDFGRFALQQTGVPFLVGDEVLSGRGLALLHRYLTGERLPPREVSRAALKSETTTLRWYARLYGRFCRNVALTTLCTGGLWIAGGIAADNPLVVNSGCFAEEFFASPRLEALLRRLPVFLVDDKNSGLWGAAYAASLQTAPAAVCE
ncbi:MAG: glucokinase [Desulfovibrio sp.]|jgi:glucokinase|nr:glucokinase [Desulfovibrio sp.]